MKDQFQAMIKKSLTLNWVQNEVGHLVDSSQWNSVGELWHPLLAWVLCDAWLWLSDQDERPLSSSSLAANQLKCTKINYFFPIS